MLIFHIFSILKVPHSVMWSHPLWPGVLILRQGCRHGSDWWHPCSGRSGCALSSGQRGRLCLGSPPPENQRGSCAYLLQEVSCAHLALQCQDPATSVMWHLPSAVTGQRGTGKQKNTSLETAESYRINRKWDIAIYSFSGLVYLWSLMFFSCFSVEKACEVWVLE